MMKLQKAFRLVIQSVALNAVCSACVMKTPVVYNKTYTVSKLDGTSEEITSSWAGTHDEFTPIGIAWNATTFGTIGTVYGMVDGCVSGYTDTNNTWFATKTLGACSGFFLGTGKGICRGVRYGYNLKYDQGRSVEGLLMDDVELILKHSGNWLAHPTCQHDYE